MSADSVRSAFGSEVVVPAGPAVPLLEIGGMGLTWLGWGNDISEAVAHLASLDGRHRIGRAWHQEVPASPVMAARADEMARIMDLVWEGDHLPGP